MGIIPGTAPQNPLVCGAILPPAVTAYLVGICLTAGVALVRTAGRAGRSSVAFVVVIALFTQIFAVRTEATYPIIGLKIARSLRVMVGVEERLMDPRAVGISIGGVRTAEGKTRNVAQTMRRLYILDDTEFFAICSAPRRVESDQSGCSEVQESDSEG